MIQYEKKQLLILLETQTGEFIHAEEFELEPHPENDSFWTNSNRIFIKDLPSHAVFSYQRLENGKILGSRVLMYFTDGILSVPAYRLKIGESYFGPRA